MKPQQNQNLTRSRRGAKKRWLVAGICLLCASAPLRETSADDAAHKAKDATIVRALLRLPGVDLASKPEAKAALLRNLDTLRGTEQYLDIVDKFKLHET